MQTQNQLLWQPSLEPQATDDQDLPIPLIEVVSHNPPHQRHPLEVRSVFDGESLLWLLLGIALSGILISLKTIFRLHWELRKESIAPIPRTGKFPCKNCRFFTHNRYLRCSVRPFAALTEESINCPDYQFDAESP